MLLLLPLAFQRFLSPLFFQATLFLKLSLLLGLIQLPAPLLAFLHMRQLRMLLDQGRTGVHIAALQRLVARIEKVIGDRAWKESRRDWTFGHHLGRLRGAR